MVILRRSFLKAVEQKTDLCQNRRLWGQKKVQKGTKRSSGPKTDLLGQNKREGGRAETKNAGVKKFSSFIWTLVVKKENGPIGPLIGPCRALRFSNVHPGHWAYLRRFNKSNIVPPWAETQTADPILDISDVNKSVIVHHCCPPALMYTYFRF